MVCNGCTDDTADVARSVPGVRVVELEEGSKPAALNAGDKAATLWPRLYLDADIQISAAAVLAVLDRLGKGTCLAARARLQVRLRRCQRVSAQLLPGATADSAAQAGDVGCRGLRTQREGSPAIRCLSDGHGRRSVRRHPVRRGRKGRGGHRSVGGENARRCQEPARDLASQLSGRRRAVSQGTDRTRDPEHQRWTLQSRSRDDPRSPIGGRCGGIPRDGARRTVDFRMRRYGNETRAADRASERGGEETSPHPYLVASLRRAGMAVRELHWAISKNGQRSFGRYVELGDRTGQEHPMSVKLVSPRILLEFARAPEDILITYELGLVGLYAGVSKQFHQHKVISLVEGDYRHIGRAGTLGIKVAFRRFTARYYRTLRGDAARVVPRETPPARARLGVCPDLLLGRRSGSDQPQRHRRRTQAPPGLAGRIEHRR